MNRPHSKLLLNTYLLLAVAVVALAVPPMLGAVASQPATFADPAFKALWERIDLPVAAGQAARSWYWGPQPNQTVMEPYSGSKTGSRLVQYFDKARMEVNNPGGDRSSEWFVTTGLLVSEMIAGKQQVGDREFKVLPAAEIAVGGDGLTADPDAPTYTSFRAVASLRGPGDNRAANRVGQALTATINRAGTVDDNPALGLFPGARVAAYSDVLGHNIPQAMWDFLNLKGTVLVGGVAKENQPLANWVYAMGYPLTEPYWARVRIENVYYDVLFQMYERRTLAYIPSFPKGWQVQMGNVGAHYYRWLYGGPLPTPLVVSARSSPTPPPIPASIDATIVPSTAPLGLPLTASLTGFRPGEEIVSWFTGPDGSATDARINTTAGLDGSVSALQVPTARLTPGLWAITFHGKAGNHESIAYFYLYPWEGPLPTATATSIATASAPSQTATGTARPAGTVTPVPTFPPVPTEPAGGLVVSVRPGFGPPSGNFAFGVTGLQPNEGVQVKFTDPNGAVVYPAGSNGGRYQADANGALSLTLVPSEAFPSAPLGIWVFEVTALSSGQVGVVGFTLR